MRVSPGWKTCTLLMVIAAHAWLGWKLANYRPDGKLAEVRSRQDARPEEVLLVLTFETRAAAAPAPAPAGKQASRPRRRLPAPMMAVQAPGPELAGAGASAAPNRPLDLRPPPPDALPVRTDPFARVPAMRHQSTRYDRAWQSDGNLTRVVARKSAIAGILLGAMGALRKPCTERERREYDAACVPGQYEHSPETE